MMGAKAEKPQTIPPTPEQMRRGRFEEENVYDRRPNGWPDLKGTAYRRKPHFETLGLSSDQQAALRFYRRQFDRTERSETPCALNDQRGGSGEGPSAGYARAREMLGICEAAVSGLLLHTLRAVALFDFTFSEVAIARYGGRKQTWIDVTMIEWDEERRTGKAPRVDRQGRRSAFVEKIVPNSGRRLQIRGEFMDAVEAVTARLKPYLRTGD